MTKPVKTNIKIVISNFKMIFSQNVRITQVSRWICFSFVHKLLKNVPNLLDISEQPEELGRCSLFFSFFFFCSMQQNQLHRWKKRARCGSLTLHTGDLTGLYYTPHEETVHDAYYTMENNYGCTYKKR